MGPAPQSPIGSRQAQHNWWGGGGDRGACSAAASRVEASTMRLLGRRRRRRFLLVVCCSYLTAPFSPCSPQAKLALVVSCYLDWASVLIRRRYFVDALIGGAIKSKVEWCFHRFCHFPSWLLLTVPKC